MQSTNNQTNVPLRVGSIYIGQNDDVLNYNSACYSIISDQNCQIELYQSNDKKTYSVATVNYTGGAGLVTNEVQLAQRYIYVTVRNSGTVNQTLLNFTLIYKTNGVVNVTNTTLNVADTVAEGYLGTLVSSGIHVTNTSLNVADTVAEGYLATLASAGVNVTNTTLNCADTVAEGYLATLVSSGVKVISFPTTNTGGVLWNGSTVSDTNTSLSVNMTGCFKNVYTVMAISSDVSTLTVQYSPNNSTWFNTTNVLNVPFAGSLALDFQTSAGYIRLIASGIPSTSIISAWINHT